MEAFKEAWLAIDAEAKGTITSRELSVYMKKQNYDDAFVNKWMRLFDQDGSGTIEVEEYCDVLGLNPKSLMAEVRSRASASLPEGVEIISADMTQEWQVKVVILSLEGLRSQQSMKVSDVNSVTCHMAGEAAMNKQSVSLSSLKMPAELPCMVCKKICPCKKCSNCSNCWYCSRECQRKDWQAHKLICQGVQDVKVWASFLEYLGGQFSRDDDKDYADCPRELNSLPILPHVVLGCLIVGGKPGQVALETCPYTNERATTIPIHIWSADMRGAETDVSIICATLHHHLNGYTLDEAVRRALPVAIRRCHMDSVGFKLPSVLHLNRGLTARTNYIFTPPPK